MHIPAVPRNTILYWIGWHGFLIFRNPFTLYVGHMNRLQTRPAAKVSVQYRGICVGVRGVLMLCIIQLWGSTTVAMPFVLLQFPNAVSLWDEEMLFIVKLKRRRLRHAIQIHVREKSTFWLQLYWNFYCQPLLFTLLQLNRSNSITWRHDVISPNNINQ